MDWCDETWVKLYRRDTTDWLALSIGARGLFCLILRAVNRSGVLDLGKTGTKAVAVHLRGEWREVGPWLDELLADGCVEVHGSNLIVRNFVAAQEAALSDKARARLHREKVRDATRGVATDDTVTKRDETITKRDETVTGGHDASRAVTPRHEEKEETRQDEGRGGVGEPPPVEAPPVAADPKASPPVVPPSGASSAPPAEPPKATKGKRSKRAPEPDTIPLPGTLARRLFDAIVGDRALAPITGNPGDAAQRWADPDAFPGVDVLAEVKRAGEYASTKPGRYTDGRSFVRGWLQRKADEVARAPKVAGRVGAGVVPAAQRPADPEPVFVNLGRNCKPLHRGA